MTAQGHVPTGDGCPIVAIVCSAGGLDAVRTVLAPLPADFPAAVVVLQHTRPDRPSQLVQLISPVVAMPVVFAADGAPLVPGQVAVAPAGFHTLAVDAEPGNGQHTVLALIPSGESPPYRPSADLLLTTLATAAGRRVIAVVLTGGGNDAATGATAVHRFGGLVIAGSPETASRREMPDATIDRDAITDYVVPLPDLAGLLVSLVTAYTLDSAPFDETIP